MNQSRLAILAAILGSVHRLGTVRNEADAVLPPIDRIADEGEREHV